MFPPSPSKVFAILAISIAMGLPCVPHTASAQQQTSTSTSQTTTYLVLQLDTDALQKAWMDAVALDARQILRDEKIAFTGVVATQQDVRVALRDPSTVDAVLEKFKPLAGSVKGALGFGEVPAAEFARDGGTIVFKPTPAGTGQRVTDAITDAVEVMEARVRADLKPVTVRRQGVNQIRLELKGDDVTALKAIALRAASLSFHLVDTAMSADKAERAGVPESSAVYKGETGEKFLLHKTPILSGTDLADAQVGFDMNNRPVVDFRFNLSGTYRFGVTTRENIGKPFAVLLEGVVIFAPVIREPILGGRGQISGDFSLDEARRLAVQMRSAAHPPKLTIIEERTVRDGPPEGQPR